MSTCAKTGKRRYSHWVAAELARAKFDRLDDAKREKKPDHAYKCGHCHGWHLTSRKKKKPRHREKGTP